MAKDNQNELPIARVPWIDRLIADVTDFHKATGMEFSTIGMKAIGNARFWERLHTGRDIGVRTADQIYFWMAAKGYTFNS